MGAETTIPIASEVDVVVARQKGRVLAEEAGFNGTDLTVIATAISEVARNIVSYAGEGEIAVCLSEEGYRRGIVVVASDQGPGIPDVDQALQDGFSTARSLGLGLPGAKRLMDEFQIESEVGRGTTVMMKKWVS